MAQGYVRTSDLPQVIPVFPLSGVILLPRGQLPLNIFEPRYLNMFDDAMGGDRIIGMIQTLGGTPQRPGLAPIGCAGRVTSFAETADGRYLVTLTGCSRFRVAAELPVQSPYRQIRADYSDFAADLGDAPSSDGDLDRHAVLEALAPYLDARGLEIDWETARGAPPEALVNSLSMALPFIPAEKQALLEALSLPDRAQALMALMRIDAAEGDDVGPIQ